MFQSQIKSASGSGFYKFFTQDPAPKKRRILPPNPVVTSGLGLEAKISIAILR